MAALVPALALAALFGALPSIAISIALAGNARRAGYMRWARRVAPTVFLGVALVSLVAGPAAGAGVGAVLVLLVAVRIVPEVRRARAVDRLAIDLGDPGRRDAAIEAVERDVARGAPPKREVAWAIEVLELAAHAFAAGATGVAVRWASRVDATRIAPAQAAVRAQIIAVGLVARGDFDGASGALASVARPAASPAIEEAMRALEALVLAIAGKLDDARVPDRAGATVATDATWRLVRAHALAARGARDEALALLRALRDDSGDGPLEMVARHNGPASPLAATLLATPPGPYR